MAISFTPGQTVSWDDFNALLAQHQSPQGAKSVTIVQPPKLTDDQELAFQDAHGGQSSAEYYRVNVIRRYHMEDGTYVDAQVDPNASKEESDTGKAPLVVVDYKPSQVYQQTQAKAAATQAKTDEQKTPPGGIGWRDDDESKGSTGRRWGWNPDTGTYDRDLGPSPAAQGIGIKPGQDQDMGSEEKFDPATGTTTKVTTFKRPDGTTYTKTDSSSKGPPTAKARETRVNPTDTTKIQEFDPTANGGQGAWVDAGLNDAEAQRRAKEADANRPGRKEEPYVNPADKKTYTKVTTTDPKTNQVRTFYIDPATGQEVTLPGSAMANVKGLPSYTPDLTKPGAGLIDRAKALDQLLQAGTITWEQRQEILAQDQVLAATVANEFNGAATMLREDYGNQVTQRGQDISNAQHRATLANSHMVNAMGVMEKFAPYLGGTKGAAGKMFLATMGAQLALATQYGGMKDYPREQLHPALAAWANRAVGGAAGPGAGTPGAGTPGGRPAGAPADAGVPPLPPDVTGPPPAPLQPLGPALNRFDTGPGNTLGPRVMTPSSRTGGMPPPPPGYEPALSWRQSAQDQEDLLAGPSASSVGIGEQALGSALAPMGASDPMSGELDFGASVGQAPLAMASSVAGLTPEQDEQARRELDRQLFGSAAARRY